MKTGRTEHIDQIPGVRRIENFEKDEMKGLAIELTHAVYPHEEMFGRFCTIHEYVDCPPKDVFDYLADVNMLEEWTYSLRDFSQVDGQCLIAATDRIDDRTKIYCKVLANESALTVDYHCAWDQPGELWMIYLMRIVPAELVLKKPGSVIIWTNCHHPYYDQNPFPAATPPGRKIWVGDLWPLFYAGHWVEMQNLKHILEARHRRTRAKEEGGR